MWAALPAVGEAPPQLCDEPVVDVRSEDDQRGAGVDEHRRPDGAAVREGHLDACAAPADGPI